MKFVFREFGDGFVSEFSYTEQKTSTKGDLPTTQKIDSDWVSKILKQRFGENWNIVETGNENFSEKDTEKLTRNQKIILDNITGNNNITTEELADIVGINLRNIKANIAKLKSHGIIERIGADKGGYWKVK